MLQKVYNKEVNIIQIFICPERSKIKVLGYSNQCPHLSTPVKISYLATPKAMSNHVENFSLILAEIPLFSNFPDWKKFLKFKIISLSKISLSKTNSNTIVKMIFEA